MELQKIKTLEIQELKQGLGMIFVKVANLAGLKDPISDINKQDIRDMVISRYQNLSLEEIDYAFKMERYGALGEKTQHFQLFNADYVSTVLNKYKAWLKEMRVANNLKLSAAKKDESGPSETEKQFLIVNGIIDCFENFQATKEIEVGRLWIYDHFYEKGHLPHHGKRFREKIRRKAVKSIYKLSNVDKADRELQRVIKKIQQGENDVRSKSKEIVLRTFFSKVDALNLDIKTFI